MHLSVLTNDTHLLSAPPPPPLLEGPGHGDPGAGWGGQCGGICRAALPTIPQSTHGIQACLLLPCLPSSTGNSLSPFTKSPILFYFFFFLSSFLFFFFFFFCTIHFHNSLFNPRAQIISNQNTVSSFLPGLHTSPGQEKYLQSAAQLPGCSAPIVNFLKA